VPVEHDLAWRDPTWHTVFGALARTGAGKRKRAGLLAAPGND